MKPTNAIGLSARIVVMLAVTLALACPLNAQESNGGSSIGTTEAGSAAPGNLASDPSVEVSIDLIGCDGVDAESLATRVGLETNKEVRVGSFDAPYRFTVGCGASQTTIELQTADAPRSRVVETAGVEGATIGRLLTVAIVELYEAAPSDVGLVVEPTQGPALLVGEYLRPAPPLPPRAAWSAGAGALSNASPLLFSPAVLASLGWRSRSWWGIAGTGTFGYSTARPDQGRVDVFTFSGSLAATVGRRARLEGPAAELGGRFTYAHLSGASADPNVETESFSDFSGGPFLAATWHWGVLGRFLLMGRLEGGYNLNGAEVTADGEVVLANSGAWFLASVGAGLYF